MPAEEWEISGDGTKQDVPTYITKTVPGDPPQSVLVAQVFGGTGDRARNARLICAAPKLLEALELMLPRIRVIDHDITDEILTLAEDAVGEATEG